MTGAQEGQGDERPAGRRPVRGPQNPPTPEEALLDPREGFLRRGGAGDGQDPDPRVLALIAAKLRLALSIGIGFFVMLVAVHLGLALSTDGGLLASLVPGLVIYPLIIGAGWFYLRRILAYDRAYREGTDA